MARLAIVVDGVAISGGINVIFEHALRLGEHGFEVVLVTRNPVQLENVSWHRIAREFHGARISWATIASLGDVKFDYAMATYWRTFFDLWRINADRYLYFIQSIESRFYPLSERILRSTVEGTYEVPAGIITEARWIRDYFQLVHGQHASLAINGIDKTAFTPSGTAVAPRGSDRLRILVEGSVTAEFKNVPRTIEVCRAANLGEVWLLTPSKLDAIPGVDRIFSQIPLASTPEVYRSCDVIVKLSLVEGVFGPPLEMFHCGGTAIVYDVTGYDEYIVRGQNALVARTGHEDDVSFYLRILAEQPGLLARLKENALKTAADYPDWEDSTRVFAQGILEAGDRSAISRDNLRDYARRLWHGYESGLREKSEAKRQ